MKIICALSSIEFNVEHFPGTLASRESTHPAFDIPQKKLLSYLGKWASSELTPTDSYLLFLSLLKSTDLVEFRVPAIRTTQTDAIIAQNMEELARAVSRLNTVVSQYSTFPHYVISTETRGLDNVKHWIENWNEAYADFKAGKQRDVQGRDEWKKLNIREAALERLIKNPHRALSSYATQIADWAVLAGSFPTWVTKNSFPPYQPISCADYWKLLIQKCAHEESLYSIKRIDLVDLLEHCEEHISAGSIYSNALFKILRHALERQKNFLGLGDMDISGSNYTILESNSSAEAANLRAMIDSAPTELPRPEQYPTKFAYMKAKMRWDMAKKHGRSEPENAMHYVSANPENTDDEGGQE